MKFIREVLLGPRRSQSPVPYHSSTFHKPSQGVAIVDPLSDAARDLSCQLIGAPDILNQASFRVRCADLNLELHVSVQRIYRSASMTTYGILVDSRLIRAGNDMRVKAELNILALISVSWAFHQLFKYLLRTQFSMI